MGQALSRSESREVAFRLIFALGQHTVLDDTVWELALDGKTAPAPEKQYINQILEKFQTEQVSFDERIKAHLQKWTIDRLRQTDLAALRLVAQCFIERGSVRSFGTWQWRLVYFA